MDSVTKNKKETEGSLLQIENEWKNKKEMEEEIKNKIVKKDINKRNLSENIRYRQQLQSIKLIENKIKEKEQYLASVVGTVQEAEQDLQPLEKEFANIKTKYDRLVGARATLQVTFFFSLVGGVSVVFDLRII